MKRTARSLAVAVFTAAIVLSAAGLSAGSADAGPKGPRTGSNVSGLDLGSSR